MFQIVREDLRHKVKWRGLPPTLASHLRVLGGEGSLAQLLYRAMRFFQVNRLQPFAFILYRLNAVLCHAVIGRGAEIGPGFVILHSHGIVINTTVRAGKNLILEHAVTIGEVRGRSPVLGDDVYIGAGAKVIGPVVVGSNVQIGANAVVTKDLPNGATAVGVPARVVKIYGVSVINEFSGGGRPE